MRNMNRMAKLIRATFYSAAGIVLGVSAYQVLAQDSDAMAADGDRPRNAMEEVIVTAQRSEESIQDVPIAVTALSGEMLEDRQVINFSDLQLNAPNVSFTATNFGNSSFSIRGVGRLVISASGESGVSTHINEIPIASNLNAIEYFDVERIEILRGPQGTLFGRNATGGAINMVTKMPSFEAFDGFVDFEYGNYDHTRTKAAINIPLGANLALRVAGMTLKRSGFIDNLAFGQENANVPGETLPGIDKDVDGRDLWAGRATLLWQPSDKLKAWVQYNQFKEDDDRVRITNQVCTQNALPTLGCEANPASDRFERPHLGATTAGIFAGTLGALPPGISGNDTNLAYDYERPNVGFRAMHTDLEPEFEQDETSVLLGVNIEAGAFSIDLLGAYQTTENYTRQDYVMDVGANLNPVAGVNDASNGNGGLYYTSDVPRGPNNDHSGPCDLRTRNAGIVSQNSQLTTPDSSCIHPYAGTGRIFAYDQSDIETTYWTAEAKIASHFDSKLNFTAGLSSYGSDYAGDYYVVSNTLDLVASFPAPLFGGLSLYPSYFSNQTHDLDQTGVAAYGELYVDLTPNFKLTFGLRYNKDEKEVQDTSVLFNSAITAVGTFRAAFAPLLSGADAPAADTQNGRLLRLYVTEAQITTLSVANAALTGPVTALATEMMLTDPSAIAMAVTTAAQTLGGIVAGVAPEMIAATVGAAIAAGTITPAQAAAGAAFGSAFAARVAVVGAVPQVPAPGETRQATASPSKFDWNEFSGRVGFDWSLSNDNLVYGFFSRGYKPGGFNPAIPPQFQSNSKFEFDAEEVNALEIGSKNILSEGSLVLNGAAFYYQYKSLQVTRIANNSSLNDNIDANIFGAELELVWAPPFASNLSVDAAYSYLNTEVDGSRAIDPINRTAGNADWITLKNIDAGSTTGVSYIARREDLTDAIITAAIAGARRGASIPVPGTFYDVSESTSGTAAIPAYISRNWLNKIAPQGAGRVGTDVQTSDGLVTDLDGKSLPNSPEHTIHLGASYAFPLGAAGSLVLRGDYYWQSDSYAREFNGGGDEIDAWDQINASLVYATIDERLEVKFWVRNITDSENVTGKYLTSDTSGFYRNYFLTEPRIYGASVRVNFN